MPLMGAGTNGRPSVYHSLSNRPTDPTRPHDTCPAALPQPAPTPSLCALLAGEASEFPRARNSEHKLGWELMRTYEKETAEIPK